MQGLHVDRQAPSRPAPPSPRRPIWPWLAGAAGLAILVAAGFWAMSATTVSRGTHDDVVAERDQALADLGDAEASRAEAQLRIDAATAEVDRLTAALTAAEAEAEGAREDTAAALADEEAMRTRLIDAERSLREAGEALEDALEPVMALTLWIVPLEDDVAAELAAAGADLAALDSALAELGVADSRESLLAADGWGFAFFSALADSGPGAEAAWEAWLETPGGSFEEYATDVTLRWELQRAIAERINDVLVLTGRPVVSLAPAGL